MENESLSCRNSNSTTILDKNDPKSQTEGKKQEVEATADHQTAENNALKFNGNKLK